jgi:cell division transport system permease protein
MYGLLGEDATMTDSDNPFSDMVEFSVKSDSFTNAYVEGLSLRIQREMPVRQVHYPSDYFDNVFGVIHTARRYLIGFILIALIMTGVLIHHIMRLNVVAQQGQIRTMELVGAKPSFIRKPFIRRGMRMGLQAWFVAIVLSIITWYVLLGGSMAAKWIFSLPGLIGMGLLLVLSLVVCGFSTWIAVTRSLGSSIMQDT